MFMFHASSISISNMKQALLLHAAWICHIIHFHCDTCDASSGGTWKGFTVVGKVSIRYFCKLMSSLVNVKANNFFKNIRFLIKKNKLDFPFICLQKVAWLTVYRCKIIHWDNTKWPFGRWLEMTTVGRFF